MGEPGKGSTEQKGGRNAVFLRETGTSVRGKCTAANFKNSEDLSLDPEPVSNWYPFHSLVLHPPTLKPACTPLSPLTSLKEGASLQ